MSIGLLNVPLTQEELQEIRAGELTTLLIPKQHMGYIKQGFSYRIPDTQEHIRVLNVKSVCRTQNSNTVKLISPEKIETSLDVYRIYPVAEVAVFEYIP